MKLVDLSSFAARMRRHASFAGKILAPVALAIVLVRPAAAQQPMYTITPLARVDNLSIVYSSPQSINEGGAIAGSYLNTASQSFAVIWHTPSNPELLPTISGSLFNGSAMGINESKQVAGTSSAMYHTTATLWTSGVATNLGVLGLPENNRSFAVAINDLGDSAGYSESEPGLQGEPVRATLSKGGGALINLGTLPVPYNDLSEGTSINNSGRVVGNARGQGGLAAFEWIPDVPNGTTGTMHKLPEPPNYVGSSQAWDINDNGVTVGDSGPAGGTMNIVLWSSGNFSDIGRPASAQEILRATAISNNNEVVGWMVVSDSFRAIHWDPVNGWLDLNDCLVNGAGWVLEIANDVNDHGQIVGRGHFNGEFYGFVLTPVAAAARWSGPLAIKPAPTKKSSRPAPAGRRTSSSMMKRAR